MPSYHSLLLFGISTLAVLLYSNKKSKFVLRRSLQQHGIDSKNRITRKTNQSPDALCTLFYFETLVTVIFTTTPTLSELTTLQQEFSETYKMFPCTQGSRVMEQMELINDLQEDHRRKLDQNQHYSYQFRIHGYCEGCTPETFALFATPNVPTQITLSQCQCNGPTQENFTKLYSNAIKNLQTNGSLQHGLDVWNVTECNDATKPPPTVPPKPTHFDIFYHSKDVTKQFSNLPNMRNDVMPADNTTCQEVAFEHDIRLTFAGSIDMEASRAEVVYLQNVLINSYNMIVFCDDYRMVESVEMELQVDDEDRHDDAQKYYQTYHATVQGRCKGCQGKFSTLFDGRNYSNPTDYSECATCPGPTISDFTFFYESLLLSGGGLMTIDSVVDVMELLPPPPPRATPMLPFPPIKEMNRFDSIRKAIIESGITSEFELNIERSAQYLALLWLTDYDHARLEPDQEAFFQRYALAVFYFSTFPNTDIQNIAAREKFGVWYNNFNWISDRGYCSWYGVSCETRWSNGINITSYDGNGNVVGLMLSENHVRGTIPSELSALTKLARLDLGKNAFSGTVPRSLLKLQTLESLLLDHNELTGTIHTEIGNLTLLRRLLLGSNKFDGTIPTEIDALTILRSLSFANNELIGPIPLFYLFKHLKIIHLDGNALTGKIPFQIDALTDLSILRLGRNYLTGTIPNSIRNLTKLQIFDVNDNVLSGSMPDSWEQMSQMRQLHVQKNFLNGVLPESISTLDMLRVLLFDSNQFVGTVPSTYGALKYLAKFHAHDNDMMGSIPTEYGTLDELSDLRLSGNQLTGTIPTELGNITTLMRLDLQDNILMGSIPSELGVLESLQGFRVQGNKLNGTVPERLCKNKNSTVLPIFLSADCNTPRGGTVVCMCCDDCFPVP